MTHQPKPAQTSPRNPLATTPRCGRFAVDHPKIRTAKNRYLGVHTAHPLTAECQHKDQLKRLQPKRGKSSVDLKKQEQMAELQKISAQRPIESEAALIFDKSLNLLQTVAASPNARELFHGQLTLAPPAKPPEMPTTVCIRAAARSGIFLAEQQRANEKLEPNMRPVPSLFASLRMISCAPDMKCAFYPCAPAHAIKAGKGNANKWYTDSTRIGLASTLEKAFVPSRSAKGHAFTFYRDTVNVGPFHPLKNMFDPPATAKATEAYELFAIDPMGADLNAIAKEQNCTINDRGKIILAEDRKNSAATRRKFINAFKELREQAASKPLHLTCPTCPTDSPCETDLICSWIAKDTPPEQLPRMLLEVTPPESPPPPPPPPPPNHPAQPQGHSTEWSTVERNPGGKGVSWMPNGAPWNKGKGKGKGTPPPGMSAPPPGAPTGNRFSVFEDHGQDSDPNPRAGGKRPAQAQYYPSQPLPPSLNVPSVDSMSARAHAKVARSSDQSETALTPDSTAASLLPHEANLGSFQCSGASAPETGQGEYLGTRGSVWGGEHRNNSAASDAPNMPATAAEAAAAAQCHGAAASSSSSMQPPNEEGGRTTG